MCSNPISGPQRLRPPPHNPIPHLLGPFILLHAHGAFLLITPLLPHMLIVPRVPFAEIRVPELVQTFGSCFVGDGVAGAGDDACGGGLVADGLYVHTFISSLAIEGFRRWVGRDGMGWDKGTLGMSLVLSATDASSVLPRSWGSSEEVVVWSGRGLEGMVRGVAESEGTVVPETAMSLRDPPCGLGSEGGDIFGIVGVRVVGEGRVEIEV